MRHIKNFLVSLISLGLTLSINSYGNVSNNAVTGNKHSGSKPFVNSIKQLLTNKVRQQARVEFYSTLPDEAIRIEFTSMNRHLQLQSCESPLTVKILSHQLQSRTSAKVNCETKWSLIISMRIEVNVPVILSSQPIAKGQVISDTLIRMDQRNVLTSAGHYFTKKKSVLGLEARRSIRAGTLLRKPLLQAARVINKGDVILLSAGSGDLRVSIQAEALSDGRIGDHIRVRNRATRKIIKAKVTTTGNAEIVW